MIKDFDEIEQTLSKLLSEKRLEHCKRVAKTAEELANYHDIDPEKAYWVGLTHDAAKYLNPETISAYNVVLTSDEKTLYKEYPSLWHAFVGPKLCEALFHLKDADMKAAIRWHTTGTTMMTPLSMLLYVADYVEPGRSYGDVGYIKSLCESSLEEATFALSVSVLKSLTKRGLRIHPHSVECYNGYLALLPTARVVEITTKLNEVETR